MAVNRKYVRRSADILDGGEVVATVHPLTGDMIKQVMLVIGQDVTDLLGSMEEMKFTFASNSDDEIADKVLSSLPGLLQKVITVVPNILAAIVAAAAEDMDGMDVIDTWPLPLQVEGVATVARLTFVDDTAFKSFVGNVLALLQAGNALTGSSASASKKSPQPSMPAGPQSLVDG